MNAKPARLSGFRHVSSRLIVWILGGAAIAFIALGLYQQRQTRRIVLEQVSGRSAAVALSITTELQGVMWAVETSVKLTAARLSNVEPEPVAIDDRLQQMINTNDRIYGSTASYEPFAVPKGFTRFAPYLFRQGDKLAKADLATPSYAYWDKDWYTVPLHQNRPIWSEPYFDQDGGNVNMVTYSVPFRLLIRKIEAPAGVITADVSLDWLKRLADSRQPGRNGFVIIFSGTGRIITHPQVENILKESLESLAKKTGQDELRQVQQDVTAGRSGDVSFLSKTLRSRFHVDYRPVGVGGWGVMVGYNEGDFLSPVERAGQIAIWSGLATLLILAIIIVCVSHWITLPLTQLATSAQAIARGDLDVVIPEPRTRDEVGHLTAVFRQMRDDLKKYLADLSAATAARQKLESEIAIAQQIQRTMLPPPQLILRGPRTLSIAAQIVPAKTVGGDLYAFFEKSSDRLCFAVGDVSDKGVPAALFMARTITLLKTLGREADAPDEILRRVNAELYPDNDECMFVTLFCGIIDLATGHIACASAGHEPPIILDAAGVARFCELPSGPALGLTSHVDLPVSSLTLAPGETLLLYTDGATDAANPAGQMFTAAGLLQAVNQLGAHPDTLALELRRRLEVFAASAPQADDITLFTLRLEA